MACGSINRTRSLEEWHISEKSSTDPSIDEIGENHLGLVINLRFKSVLLEGLPVFLIMASLWNKVNFPWGTGFSYGTSLQLRRPVLSPWLILDKTCWKGFLCLLSWSPVFKSTYTGIVSEPKKGNPAGWLACPSSPLCPPHSLPWGGTTSLMIPSGQGSEPAGKEGGRFAITELSKSRRGDFSLALVTILGWAGDIPFLGKEVLRFLLLGLACGQTRPGSSNTQEYVVGSRERGVEQLTFTISERFSWFRQPLEKSLQPQATNIEINSLLICPQNQLITKSAPEKRKYIRSGTTANLYH